MNLEISLGVNLRTSDFLGSASYSLEKSISKLGIVLFRICTLLFMAWALIKTLKKTCWAWLYSCLIFPRFYHYAQYLPNQTGGLVLSVLFLRLIQMN